MINCSEFEVLRQVEGNEEIGEGTAGIEDHRTRIVQERDLIMIGI